MLRDGFVPSHAAWGAQASVNPKAETVEELLARRKNLHMGMLKLAKEDLALTLQAGIDDFKVLNPPQPSIIAEFFPCGCASGADRR
jgi:hypothetical protein